MKLLNIFSMFVLIILLSSCTSVKEKSCTDFESINEESNTLFQVYCSDKNGEYSGYVNENGNLVIPFYQVIFTDSQLRVIYDTDSLFVVSVDDERFGIVDSNNITIEPQDFESIIIIDNNNYILQKDGEYLIKDANNGNTKAVDMDYIYQINSYVIGKYLNDIYILNDDNEFVLLGDENNVSFKGDYAIIKEDGQTNILSFKTMDLIWSSSDFIEINVIFINDTYLLIETDEVILIEMSTDEVILSNIQTYNISENFDLLYLENDTDSISLWENNNQITLYEYRLFTVYSSNYIYIENDVLYARNIITDNSIELTDEFIISFNYLFVSRGDDVYIYDENLGLIGVVSQKPVQFVYLDGLYNAGYVQKLETDSSSISEFESYVFEYQDQEIIYGVCEDYLLVALRNKYGEDIVVYTFMSSDKVILFKGNFNN